MNDLGHVTVGRAMQLAAAVHDYDTTVIAGILTNADLTELRSVCVALAAMVDVESTPRSMLAWNDNHDVTAPPPLPTGPVALRPCGTHSAFARHRKRGEKPCAPCIEGERTYQRLRKRQSRAAS